MDFTDVSLTALRVFRAVADRGTFTAAAASLGYTQSAVSRQIAAIERAAGAELLERRRDGVRLTTAGRLVLRRAKVVLDEIDATARELSGLPGQAGTVRLGWFPSAGAVLVPRTLAALRATDPALHVVGREGTTPALVRALRAGSVDLALLASAPPFRPPDTESPALVLTTLTERPCTWPCPRTIRWPGGVRGRGGPARAALDRQFLLGRGPAHGGVARPGRAAGDRPHNARLARQAPAGRRGLRTDHGARRPRPGRSRGRACPARARRPPGATAPAAGPPPQEPAEPVTRLAAALRATALGMETPAGP